MAKQAAHDSSDECSNHSSLKLDKDKLLFVFNIYLYIYIKYIVRVLELVDRINLSFIDENRERSSRFSDNYLFFF